MANILWIAFYINCNILLYRLYEKLYLQNIFNLRYKEQNNNTDILNPFYRIVNLVKSIGLALFTIPAFYIMFNYENYNNNINYIHFLAALYSSLDFSAMCFNPTCHISTKIHHTLVQILYFYGVFQNWNQNSIAYLIFIYATYSSASYLVNGRLAIRQFNINENTEYMINDLSLVFYVFNAYLNWCSQLYYLMFFSFYDHIIIKMLYVGLVCMIIYDDIFLMKYLHKNTKYIPKQKEIEDFVEFTINKNPIFNND